MEEWPEALNPHLGMITPPVMMSRPNNTYLCEDIDDFFLDGNVVHQRKISLEQKAMKYYENQLTTALLIDAPKSLLTSACMAQGRQLISPWVLRKFENLDDSVPYNLMCRYLLTQIHRNLTSQYKLLDLLEVFSSIKQTCGALSLIRQYYDCLLSGQGQATPEFCEGGAEILCFETNVPMLTECLADYSSKWKEIATSLRLPHNKIENILAKRLEPVMTLKEVILSWVLCECKDAMPPTLGSLERALRSKIVGLGAKANSLRTEFHSFARKHPGREKLDNSTYNTKKIILDQSRNICIQEGKSALLEVQISRKVEDTEVCFLWEKYDCGSYRNVSELEGFSRFDERIMCFSGFDERIMCLVATDLSFEGTYRCTIFYKGKEFSSDLIVVTVHTSLDGFKKVLVDRYTAQPEIPVDTWPPVSSGTFINLALIKQKSIHTAGEYGRCTIRGDMDDILEYKESITYDEAMGNLLTKECLLIEGRPGSGKTTFVHKFTRDWARKNKCIDYVRLLFLIHLRGFASKPNVELKDIIGCYFTGHPGMDVIIDYAVKHNGLGFCFILDGLDEYLPIKKDVFIFRLIRKQALPKSVVIVASRPAAAADLRSIATKQVEVLGFLRDEIHNYVAKYPFSVVSKHKELCEYLAEHPNIFHMCYLPIHASVICFLFDHVGSNLPETETEIYAKFTNFAILRMLCRDSEETCLESIDDLHQLQKEHYFKICKLAFEMTLSSRQVMLQKEVMQFLGQPDEKDLFGLVSVDKMAEMCGFQRLYTYLHLTFQEFLAANHISSLNRKDQLELISKYGREPQMKQAWKFYCGLAHFHSQTIHFDTLVNHAQHGTLFNMQCSFESQKPCTCDSVVQNNSISLQNTFLTTSDFTAMAFVISNAKKERVLKVVLDRCTIGCEGADALVKKSNARLSFITALCFHGYDSGVEQFSALNKIIRSLSGLKILDITSTILTKEILLTLTKDLQHSTLKILKVSGAESYLLCPVFFVADIFVSKCKNFVNVCFSGSDRFSGRKKHTHYGLPFHFYCNVEDVNMSFCNLGLVECEVLSADLINSHCTSQLLLINCGIDDDKVSLLAQGIKHCRTLEVLHLSSNNISCEGATSLAGSISGHKLHTLNLSCNRIGDKGAMKLAHTVKNIEDFHLHLWSNSITNFSQVLAIMPSTSFDTFEVVERNIQNSDSSFLSSIVEIIGTHSLLGVVVLDLSGWPLPLEVANSLAKMVKNCTNLQAFHCSSHLAHNDDGSFRALSDALKHCKNLNTLTIPGMIFETRGAKALASLLVNYACFNKLDISHSKVHKSNHSKICESIGNFLSKAMQCCMIHSLDISSCGIGSNGATALSFGLSICTGICELFIGSNDIEDTGACALASALKHCIDLTTLSVHNNKIKSKGASALSKSIAQCTRLTTFNIRANDIRDSGACALANTFKHCTSLSILNISYNNIQGSGAHILAESLSHCTKLTSLNFRGNDIGDRGCCALSTYVLKHCKGLNALDVCSNSIGVDSAQAFTNGLFSCTNLSTLDVSRNVLVDKGANLISEGLASCINLAVLLINNNDIGDDGACAVAESIVHCLKLTTLNISCNRICDRGTEVLMGALVHCIHLNHLDLHSNQIGPAGARSISAAVKHWKKLNKLSLSRNYIGKGGVTALAESLQACTSLRVLELNSCGIELYGPLLKLKECTPGLSLSYKNQVTYL